MIDGKRDNKVFKEETQKQRTTDHPTKERKWPRRLNGKPECKLNECKGDKQTRAI